MLNLILLLAAFICFILAAVNVASKVNLVAAGLACVTLAALLDSHPVTL